MARLRPDDLAAHAASMRSLAAHLLRDEHLGEDVSQDAVVAALERPPRAGTPLGPWLRGVARHLSFRTMRSDSRRRLREASAARGERFAAEDDVVERMETRQAVAAELLALEEPYRRTLLLRYFEDLEPSEIARREGVPPGTVRSRLKRGLDILRARLDARCVGDGRAWAWPLAALLGEPRGAPATSASATPLTAGALLMSAKWIAAALLAAAAGGAAWLALGTDAETDVAAGETVPPTSAPARDEASPRSRAAAVAEPAEPPPTDVPSPPSVLADVWVAGGVVGEGRHPAADVEVALVPRNTDVVRVRSDERGRFRLPVRHLAQDATPLSATVHAVAPDGRAALATIVLSPSKDDADAGTLVLGPAQDVEVRVEDGGAPAAGVGVAVRGSWVVAQGATDATGRVVFRRLPEAAYSFEARDAVRGHAVADATISKDGGPVVLTMTRREIVVAVVRKGTGAPVPGVRVDASYRRDVPGMGVSIRPFEPPLPLAPTGGDGTTTLVGVGRDDDVTISVRPPGAVGAQPMHLRSDIRVKPGETSVRFELPALRAYRWRILEGEVPPPAEGTPLELRVWANSGSALPAAAGVVRGGEVVVDADGVERFSCFACTPDGAMAMLRGSADGPEIGETTFRRERTIEAAVRTADGAPARGHRILARDQGNNAMVPAVSVGEDGVAVIRGLYGWLAEVHVLAPGASEWGGTRIGSVDLEKGSGKLEFTLPGERRVLLRFDVDGRAALPTRFHVVGARIVEEDPRAGTATLAVVAGATGPQRLRVAADGYPPAGFEVAPGDEPAEASVTLRRGATFVARVLLPSDGRAQVSLQRWTASASRWDPAAGGRGGPNGMPVDPSGAVRIEGVEAGRLRLFDGASRVAGREIDVEAGATGDAGTFDLSKSGSVRGRVVVPDGATTTGAAVVVEVDGAAAMGPSAAFDRFGGSNVGRNGEFTVRVPGDRPVRLRVSHPTLRPAASGGVVGVVEPREGVELRLERGPVVTLRGREPIKAPGTYEPGRILVFSGEPGATPAATLLPAYEDGALRFAAPPPGRYTLWFDVAPWAPLVLRDVVIGAEDLDLGTLAFPRGSSVRIRLLLKEGADAPRISAWSWPVEEPRCSRGLNSNGEKECVLRGLGPGRHEVQTMLVMSDTQPARKHTVEVDGAETTEVVIEMDLR